MFSLQLRPRDGQWVLNSEDDHLNGLSVILGKSLFLQLSPHAYTEKQKTPASGQRF